MENVRIVPGKTGQLVTPGKNNKEYGFIQMESVEHTIVNGWLRQVKRNCLLRGDTEGLSNYVKSLKDLTLPGKICILEYTEDTIPANIQKEFLNQNLPFSEAISPFVKRAGADGPVLTKDGKKIVKFQKYDMSGDVLDVMVSHDNVTEVMASKALKDKASVKLPG
jgi:hypothetical protein